MSQFETYLLLFTDVLTSNFAFNISSEIVFGTMQIFGKYSNQLMVLVASFAYMFSICANYIFGKICYKILAPVNKNETELNSKIQNIQNFRLLPIIIALSCMPFFGKFIILFSGFCRINFKIVFIISIVTKIAYYILLITYY